MEHAPTRRATRRRGDDSEWGCIVHNVTDCGTYTFNNIISTGSPQCEAWARTCQWQRNVSKPQVILHSAVNLTDSYAPSYIWTFKCYISGPLHYLPIFIHREIRWFKSAASVFEPLELTPLLSECRTGNTEANCILTYNYRLSLGFPAVEPWYSPGPIF